LVPVSNLKQGNHLNSEILLIWKRRLADSVLKIIVRTYSRNWKIRFQLSGLEQGAEGGGSITASAVMPVLIAAEVR
jgi:hypothetical protein